jgi:hypothetical protein
MAETEVPEAVNALCVSPCGRQVLVAGERCEGGGGSAAGMRKAAAPLLLWAHSLQVCLRTSSCLIYARCCGACFACFSLALQHMHLRHARHAFSRAPRLIPCTSSVSSVPACLAVERERNEVRQRV